VLPAFLRLLCCLMFKLCSVLYFLYFLLYLLCCLL
jgi:hypothetical protein